MGSHSRFSPSSTEREYTCPGSFLLNEMEPDRQSPDAAHGTAAHHIGELCLRLNHDVETYAACVIAVDKRGNCRFVHEKAPLKDDPDFYDETEIELGFEVDDEMVVAVQEYVDRCRVLPGEHFVEVRVEHTDWCPDKDEYGMPLDPQYGTSDHVACIQAGAPGYDESTIVVTDLKYGKGVMVFAKENKQAIKYALGSWKTYDWLYGFKRVVIRICQPRLNHFDEWELTVEELLEWGQKIKERLTLVFAPEPPFQASEKGCKFCKVAYLCASKPGMALYEERHRYVAMQFDDLTGEPIHNPRLLAEEDLMAAYSAAPFYKIAAEAVEKEVFRRLARGESAGRKKLVAAHTHRAWKDEEAAREFLRSKGVDDTKSTTKVFVSPAGAEKLLPRALWPDLEGLYERPPGRPCVVDESDPRPPYRDRAVVEEFEDIEDDGF